MTKDLTMAASRNTQPRDSPRGFDINDGRPVQLTNNSPSFKNDMLSSTQQKRNGIVMQTPPKYFSTDYDLRLRNTVSGDVAAEQQQVVLRNVRASGDDAVPVSSYPPTPNNRVGLPHESMHITNSNMGHAYKPTEAAPMVAANDRWYHGRISREDAEELLWPFEDGVFLVRESTNFPGDFTLCVCFQKKVEHYRIINDSLPPPTASSSSVAVQNSGSQPASAAVVHRFTIDEEEYFDSLSQLIRHYTRDADGLCTNLRKALPRNSQSNQSSSSRALQPSAATTKTLGEESKILNLHAQAFKDAGWMIAPEELILGDTLGCGEFADVHLATYQGQKVAVKTLKQQEPGSTQALLTEASLMTSMRHPNLVSLCGICVTFDPVRISLVTEYMSQGSLIEYLRSRGRHKLTKRDLLNFASDTCAGMAYLESRQFIHRDLAARNVLLNNECTAKVADFGLARSSVELDSTNNNNTAVNSSAAADDAASTTTAAAAPGSNKLPVKWTAPEALRRGEFSNKSDVWSFGILLWELFSFGRVPYPRIAVDQVERLVCDKGYRMEAPEECPDQIFETMKKCWSIEPAKRPTFAHMLCYIDDLRKELS